MPRTLFVLTLGFEEKYAVRMVTRHGLDRGDELLVVTGPRVERSERAINYLREFVGRYYQGEVGFSVLEVDVRDVVGAAAEIKSAILERAERFARVVVNLSGGMRALVLAAFCAALAAEPHLSGRELLIELELEDGSATVEVPGAVLRAAATAGSLSPEKLEVLQRLVGGERTMAELARELGRDVSTVRRHVLELERTGLVELTGGRPYRARLSRLAELLL